MIEPICTLIAVAVGSAAVVALYYRICHPAKFWRVVASWHRAVGRHIANERYILDVRAGLAARPDNTRKSRQTATVIDNGIKWEVESR